MFVDLPDKLYYSIGEVSRAFNVNPSLIRFWEKEFSIIQPKKNKKGNRFFTPKDIENLRVIYHLVKERGYTLEGAKIALEEQKGLVEEIEVITRLENVKAELLKIKESLDDMNDE
ncbi:MULTISPECIES: MerR family transcriptional regulator [Weeksella]|uniref:Transcriptional regulator, MerR family n=1 Tax=Weeksella virosa (strain ATCC 43766 / DSM 16922 / JCM 21250 / CCUG 30538 / CDC 9751 / IAM 14551 / NBRC 16016 / NCTC 11634 / CL345/78) TaxID=865938 RepID=F0NXW6_WEEVC|nr:MULTISPECIES: MerR family transcriptional regulator [Weeksella]ADX68034.1 transcriptional regulator, MerR family [Weeksella virosa DSM 16922]MDK7375891.1 MerR family transcriptional regulator [Weeksella virosa]MDK7676212.1 MerR family transcriptional regulator [Weeksella virosa]OFM83829.1 transcriptional regulator [Weeksella sp. HMSC059D05]SUP54342.1 Zn(II)-responsive regulator of zntA [Weeksella virosa]